jgi:UDP-4-keto-D-QuiNAc 4-reductase
MTRVLVTGASGFVGRALLARLGATDWYVGAITRRQERLPGAQEQWRAEISDVRAIRDAVARQDIVIHLAARVHQLRDRANDPLAAFRSVNVEYALQIAQAAANSGAKRFVFVSTAKVFGEIGAFSETSLPRPSDPYSVSKLEAERALFEIGSRTGMEIVCVRPPLVYGPGVQANFRKLIELVKLQAPLPFGAIRNRRSFIASSNLADFLVCCAHHPRAANQVLLATDGEDLSTPDLLRRLAFAMQRRIVLMPFSPRLLRLVADAAGFGGLADRLFESFRLNIDQSIGLLGWRPPVTIDSALRATVSEI